MIRFILFLVLFFLIYQAAKVILLAAIRAYSGTEGQGARSQRLAGEEMVLDPNCNTYVVKSRAVARRSRGATTYFCSAACAEEYERNSSR